MKKEKPQSTPAHITNKSERTLSTIATIILYAGLIGAFVLILLAVVDFINYEDNGLIYLASGIALGCVSVIYSVSLRVKCNISNNLRELNQKTKDQNFNC